MIEQAPHRPSAEAIEPPSICLTSAREWAQSVFGAIPLPDKRLSKRLVDIAATMAEKPADSIPQAFGDWAGSKAAYRLIANKRITPEILQRGFREHTVLDCAGRQTVIIAQDTTSIKLNRASKNNDLGPIGDGRAKGLCLHSAIAMSEDGLPIGLVSLKAWARTGKRAETHNQRKRLPIEEKESFKWLRSVRETRQALSDLLSEDERPRVIWAGDRENDIFEALSEFERWHEGFVIRCSQNRVADDEQGRRVKAREHVRQAPVLGQMRVDVTAKGGRAGRVARVELRAVRLTLHAQYPHDRSSEPVRLNLVEAFESDAPEGCEPLHWILWSSEPASTFADVERIMKIYGMRWRTEDYHKILKSGCRIEDLRFHTVERLVEVLSIYGPIAVRILAMRDLARLDPECPCTLVLGEMEWRVLFTQIHTRPPDPQTPVPTTRQAVLWIGRLGGHLGRKSDGMPGIVTLWRGWRDLARLVDFYAAMQG